jgi:hypothetical protein
MVHCKDFVKLKANTRYENVPFKNQSCFFPRVSTLSAADHFAYLWNMPIGDRGHKWNFDCSILQGVME